MLAYQQWSRQLHLPVESSCFVESNTLAPLPDLGRSRTHSLPTFVQLIAAKNSSNSHSSYAAGISMPPHSSPRYYSGGNNIATSSYGDVPLLGTAQPTVTYYEPSTNQDKMSIPTETNQSVAPSKNLAAIAVIVADDHPG